MLNFFLPDDELKPLDLVWVKAPSRKAYKIASHKFLKFAKEMGLRLDEDAQVYAAWLKYLHHLSCAEKPANKEEKALGVFFFKCPEFGSLTLI